MRMRKKKNLESRFAACADVIEFDPEAWRGHWRTLFDRARSVIPAASDPADADTPGVSGPADAPDIPAVPDPADAPDTPGVSGPSDVPDTPAVSGPADPPLHIEIGCGKGQFAVTMAAQHPDINFIAIEREPGALIMGAERCQMAPLPNLRFVVADSADLDALFTPGEVDRVYLNFSDPWPPNRQRKRRLTWRAYLAIYERILHQHGDICFKTDNQRFFEWTIQEICQFGWLIQNVSLDLHHSSFEGNVMTEYEEKFAAAGSRIYRLEARRRLPEFLRA